jgi:hypothetical protein
VRDLRLREPAPLPEGCGLPAEAWHQPPTRVRPPCLSRLTRGDALDARGTQDASHSRRPPSADAPAPNRPRRPHAAARRTPGATRGPPGPPPLLLAPPATVSRFPAAWAGGQPGRTAWIPSSTPQGSVGARRSALQALGAAVCGLAWSPGARQKRVARGPAASMPPSTALGDVAHAAPVNAMDETSWRTPGDRYGLWGMAHPEGAYCPRPSAPPPTAPAPRIADRPRPPTSHRSA